MDVINKFIITVGLVVFSTTSGYASRRLRLVPEHAAKLLMTFMAVAGYSSVGFLTIWRKELSFADAWLPVLCVVQVSLMAGGALVVGRLAGLQRRERGLFSIASGLANTGFTMGGFIIFLLHGEEGLGLVSMYNLFWLPMVVLVMYPIARHHASDTGEGSLRRLILRSILDWRSVGLITTTTGILLSLYGPERPEFFSDWHVVDVLIFAMTSIAYFGIGLRLHFSHLAGAARLVASLAAVRFLLSPVVAMLLLALTMLTPLPLTGLRRDVFLMEATVPTAVTMVAIANMFNLEPRKGSLLFVTNTLIYLAVVLPIVLWLFA